MVAALAVCVTAILLPFALFRRTASRPVAGPPAPSTLPQREVPTPSPGTSDEEILKNPPNPMTTPPAEFQKAKERARQAGCRGNLKEIRLALDMYRVDWDDHFPLAEDWADLPLVYLGGNKEIFRCPSLPGEQCGYAYNAQLACRRLADIARPAQVVVVFDAKGGWNLSGGPELVVSRHPDGPPIAFADGHVKSVGSSPPSSWVWSPTR